MRNGRPLTRAQRQRLELVALVVVSVLIAVFAQASVAPSTIGDHPIGVLIAGVILAFVFGFASRTPPLLIGLAALSGFPLWAIGDLVVHGGHNLLPFELALYGVYMVIGIVAAVVGRVLRPGDDVDDAVAGQIARGTHLELRDEGEGWFPGIAEPRIGGTIEESLGSVRGGGYWYSVRLDHPLELQESGHATPSGYRLVRYERVLVSARYEGERLFTGRAVTSYVCLLPDAADPVAHLRSIESPHVWASCTLGA